MLHSIPEDNVKRCIEILRNQVMFSHNINIEVLIISG